MLALLYLKGVWCYSGTLRCAHRPRGVGCNWPSWSPPVSIAALFNLLRRRIKSSDRPQLLLQYDAAKTLEAFSAKLREETDLDALSDDLTSVVRETMQPEHVSLWLRPDTPRKSRQSSSLLFT